ncbi:hypothetical protein BO86DRAFT_399055 [Aspergillus japonicus CBS 114.51]|uniref:Uncharacterized protein n=1 Tax=Aspergillus japonicus CBS 114.51 TaxID=1448312 RepID=A0A8T8X391_ASPJA|nr:hypothetical protein BO86DRAFT_399055 [Aspergillus japonicus CBS 114.51]RAH82414.1 hypothetical protein BO86DRAFT_399055 [Aspergillus japonicus CBS 114.51]
MQAKKRCVYLAPSLPYPSPFLFYASCKLVDSLPLFSSKDPYSFDDPAQIRPVLHPLFPQSNPSLVYGRPPPAAALFNNLWQADWTYFGLPRESTTFPFHPGTERAAQVYRTLQSRLNLLDLLEVEVHREHMTEGFPGGLHALVEICGGREVLLMDPAPVEELQPWLGLIIEACFRLRGAVVLIHSLVGAHWSPERTRRVGQLQHRTYSALVARDAFRAADDDSDVSMADAD